VMGFSTVNDCDCKGGGGCRAGGLGAVDFGIDSNQQRFALVAGGCCGAEGAGFCRAAGVRAGGIRGRYAAAGRVVADGDVERLAGRTEDGDIAGSFGTVEPLAGAGCGNSAGCRNRVGVGHAGFNSAEADIVLFRKGERGVEADICSHGERGRLCVRGK
jgi:hypothetical protein